MSAIEQQDVEMEPERCAAGRWLRASLHYSRQTASGGLARHRHRNAELQQQETLLTSTWFLLYLRADSGFSSLHM